MIQNIIDLIAGQSEESELGYELWKQMNRSKPYLESLAAMKIDETTLCKLLSCLDKSGAQARFAESVINQKTHQIWAFVCENAPVFSDFLLTINKLSSNLINDVFFAESWRGSRYVTCPTYAFTVKSIKTLTSFDVKLINTWQFGVGAFRCSFYNTKIDVSLLDELNFSRLFLDRCTLTQSDKIVMKNVDFVNTTNCRNLTGNPIKKVFVNAKQAYVF